MDRYCRRSPSTTLVIARVHDPAFVEFLESAHSAWAAHYGDGAGAAIPSCWPARGLRERRDGDIESRLGSYSFDGNTHRQRHWHAARTAADVALSGARAILEGERGAFALTRPPGHHASADVFGGYCYLNNVAIAAQWLCDQGLRPAILDVDYHHGNGTQAIFYRRSDVFFCSLHADPSFAYPHFLGFGDERGEGAGDGATLNLPLPRFTAWNAYADALFHADTAITSSGSDVLLVSLGLDTFEHDPISISSHQRGLSASRRAHRGVGPADAVRVRRRLSCGCPRRKHHQRSRSVRRIVTEAFR